MPDRFFFVPLSESFQTRPSKCTMVPLSPTTHTSSRLVPQAARSDSRVGNDGADVAGRGLTTGSELARLAGSVTRLQPLALAATAAATNARRERNRQCVMRGYVMGTALSSRARLS